MKRTEYDTPQIEFAFKYKGREIKFSLPYPPCKVEGGETDIDKCYIKSIGDYRTYCYEEAVREDMFLHFWHWFVEGDGVSDDELETLLGTRGDNRFQQLKEREHDNMQEDTDITGGANGSYFLWIADAHRALMFNDDLLKEALEKTFATFENAVKADMLIREYLVDKYFDEIWDFFVSELRKNFPAPVKGGKQ